MNSVCFVLSGFSFPPSEGLHSQAAELIRSLRSRGWRVRCIIRVQRGLGFDQQAFLDSVGGLDELIVAHSTVNYPVQLLLSMLNWPFGATSRIKAAIRVMANADHTQVWHVEGIPLMPLAGLVPVERLVLSEVDAWSLRQRRLADRSQGLRRIFFLAYQFVSAYVEKKYLPLAKCTHVVSEVDRDYLKSNYPMASVQCIPIALPLMERGRIVPTHSDLPRLNRFVFWGDIGVEHLRAGLLWLFDEVFPQLRQREIQFECVVLGRREPDEALRAACPEAIFRTWVDDIGAVISDCDLVLLPDRSGTGMKNRTIQAMALNVPVAGSSAAFEGIPVTDGVHAYMRDDAGAFADAIVTVVADRSAARKLSDRGCEFVNNRYALSTVVTSWESLYRTIQGNVSR